MSNLTKVVDGFLWLIVTDKAKEIFISGLFDLYILHDDSSESLIEGFGQLVEALENGMDIGIEGGHLPKKETQADLQKELVQKSGINIVTCGECAEVMLHRATDEVVVCPFCEFSNDPCHFPDLYY